jgi:hypothetical protein
MDLALASLVTGLATVLNRRLPFSASNSNKSFRLSLVLSFSLFGLGVLDATPTSWNLVLGTIEPPATALPIVTLTTAYRCVLWAIAALVVVVGPCAIGSHVAYRLCSSSTSFCPTGARRRQYHWALRAAYFLTVKLPVHILISSVQCLRSWRGKRRNQLRVRDYLSLPMQISREAPANKVHWLIGIPCRYWRQVWGSAVAFFFMFIFLQVVGPMVIPRGANQETLLAQVISKLTAVGVVVSALLNGYGSVSFPYFCLAGLWLEPVHPDAVVMAKRQLLDARALLAKRQMEMQSNEISTGAPVSLSRTMSWSSKKSSFSDLGEAVLQRRKNLLVEVEFLQTLSDELAQEASEMRHSGRMAQAARTPVGRLRSFIGVVFSVVLLVRLCAAAISVWTAQQHSSGPRGHADPVTVALMWVMGGDSHEYYNALSQCTSLALTAILSFSQVRSFLYTLSAINRLSNSWYRKCYCHVKYSFDTPNVVGSRGNAVLSNVVASLLTSYCLACSVLTKNLIPVEYRSSFSNALGGADIFHVRLHAVNTVFLSATVVSATVLGIILGIQRQNTYRYLRATEGTTALSFIAAGGPTIDDIS